MDEKESRGAYKTFERCFDGSGIEEIGLRFLEQLHPTSVDGKIPVTKVTLDRPNQCELEVEEGAAVLGGVQGGRLKGILVSLSGRIRLVDGVGVQSAQFP
jgi:hypothetical protein